MRPDLLRNHSTEDMDFSGVASAMVSNGFEAFQGQDGFVLDVLDLKVDGRVSRKLSPRVMAQARRAVLSSPRLSSRRSGLSGTSRSQQPIGWRQWPWTAS